MFTKGEWKRGSLEDEPFARSCLSIYQEDGRRIAEISREGFMRIEEAEANARLIASAPDMYKLLRNIAEMKVMPVSYIEQARNIIAKVEEL